MNQETLRPPTKETEINPETVEIDKETLEKLMLWAQQGEGEIRNMTHPNMDSLQRQFRKIYFELKGIRDKE
ncbi:MAG: hypothetical protein ACFFG0_28680 [Candidatus Thorarchaeota archaeon]